MTVEIHRLSNIEVIPVPLALGEHDAPTLELIGPQGPTGVPGPEGPQGVAGAPAEVGGADGSVQFNDGGALGGLDVHALADGAPGVRIGSGSEAYHLTWRGAAAPGIAVPTLRPHASDAPIALDIMPNGSGGSEPTGLAWIHLLKQDLVTAVDPGQWQAMTIAVRPDECVIGAMSGGDMAVLPINISGAGMTFKSKLTGSGTITFATLGALGLQLAGNTSQDAQAWIGYDWTRFKAGYQVCWTPATGHAFDTPDLGIGRAGAGVLEVNAGSAGTLAQLTAKSVRVATYTVATVPSAASEGAGAVVYVSDASGGATLAVSTGSTWRMMTTAPLA